MPLFALATRRICHKYDTRCYFNVRSKADISQLNLLHGTKNYKAEKTEKLKSKKTDMLRSIGKQSRKSMESVRKKKAKATVEKLYQIFS